LRLVKFVIGDLVGIGFAGFEEIENSLIVDTGESGLEVFKESRDAGSYFLLEVAVVSFAGPSGDNVLKREVVSQGFDLKEIADAGLIKHVVLDLADGIGGGGHDLLFDGLRVVGEHDLAVVRGGGFTHFFLGVLEVADTDAVFGVHELGLFLRCSRKRENFGVLFVEFLGKTASELDVLELVFAYGNIDSIIKQDISRHEDGIVKNADIDAGFAIAFVFELSHTVEITHAGNAI